MLKRVVLFCFCFISMAFSQEYKIGFPQDDMANDWRKAQVLQVQEEVKKYPFLKLDVKDAQGKVSNQIADIEYFIHNNYDFIITSPINPKISAQVLKKAMDKNIKVILISRGIHTQDYTTFIQPNNYQIAQDAALYMAKKLNYKGTVLMLKGIETSTASIARTEGFIEAMKAYPQIQIIEKTANYLRADAIKVMEEIYANKIHFDAIYSQSDSMLSGARHVMKKEGKDLGLLMVGIDYHQEVKEAIQKGEQTASFVCPTGAKESVLAIVDIINKKQVPKNIFIQTQLVTQQNAHEVEPIF